MPIVHVERTIAHPHHHVWDALDDFGNIANFHPLVHTSASTNDTDTGQGAQRVCHFENGATIHEEIVAYTADENYVVRIIDTGSFPIKTADVTFITKPLESDRTLVTMAMDFVPKFGPLGWLMGKTVMKTQFTKVLSSVLAGLERHLETGQVVGPKDKLTPA